jgi:arsenite methyltransferase
VTGIGSRLLEKGFGCPSGLLGRIGGWLMARSNAATELHLVELADLGPDDVVLILGSGPGIGLQAAGARSSHVIGIDPSEVMLQAARRRCATLIEQGRVQLVRGVAQDTGQPDASADVVLAVNSVQIWPDWEAAFAEVHRVLRPGGRLLLSAHERWLPGGLAALATAVRTAGFDAIQSWIWQPPGRGAGTAAQLSARRPVADGPSPPADQLTAKETC